MLRNIIMTIFTAFMAAGADMEPCILWQKSYGVEGRNDICYDAILSSTGDIIAVGVAAGHSYGDNGAGLLLAFDTLGNNIWRTELFAGKYKDTALTGVSVTELSNGKLFILARNGSNGGHLIRALPGGSIEWQKPMREIFGAWGSYNYPYMHCVTSEGNIVVSGSVTCGAYNSCMYLGKATADGDSIWYRRYNFTPAFNFQRGEVVIADENDAVLVGGTGAYHTDTYFNAMILNIDKESNEVWFAEYGEKLYETVADIAKLANGDLACALDRYTDLWNEKHLWLLRTKPTGDTIWTRTYKSDSGNVNACRIFPTEDNGLFIVGSCQMSRWEHAVYVSQIDGSGDTIWTFRSPIAGQLTIETAIHLREREFILFGDTRSPGTSEADIRIYRVGFRHTPTIAWMPSIINARVGVPVIDSIAAIDAEGANDSMRYHIVRAVKGVSVDSLTGQIVILAPPDIAGQHIIVLKATDKCGLAVQDSFALQVDVPYDCPIKYYPYQSSKATIDDSLKWFGSSSKSYSTRYRVTIGVDSSLSSPLVKTEDIYSLYLTLKKVNQYISLKAGTKYYWQVEEFEGSERKSCEEIMSFVFSTKLTISRHEEPASLVHPVVRRLHAHLIQVALPLSWKHSRDLEITMYDVSGRIIAHIPSAQPVDGHVLISLSRGSRKSSAKHNVMLCTITGSGIQWTAVIPGYYN